MNSKRNSSLTQNSQELRKNMTKEEKHLWYDFLKNSGWSVKRQKIVGHYIVDFCISDANIIIELDGSQHYEKEAREYDQKRDEFLASFGYIVLRYTNTDVNKNFYGVCRDILKHVERRTPHQPAVDGCQLPLKGKP